jgi:uncharacterized protein YkwD
MTAFAASCAPPAAQRSPAAQAGYAPLGAFAKSESRIFALINSERRQRGLAPLAYNWRLDRMAKIQADQMATFQTMEHVLPGAELPTLVDRARRVGYVYRRIAENVALGYPSAEAVVEGWMASKGHRENILDDGVIETGIGISRSSAGGVYFCQVFGRRIAPSNSSVRYKLGLIEPHFHSVTPSVP